MGLFNTKKIINTYAISQRMLEDDKFVPSNKTAMTAYLNQNKGDLYQDLLQAKDNALPAKYKKAYQYAKKNYVFGLPTSGLSNQPVKAILDSLTIYLTKVEGNPVTVVYGFIDQANLYHFAWKLLLDKYGYDSKTNMLTTVGQYLQSANLVLSEDTKLLYPELEDYEGLSFEFGQTDIRTRDTTRALTVITDSTDGKDYLSITYPTGEVNPDTQEKLYTTIQEDLSYLNPTDDDAIVSSDKDYVQAMYIVNGVYKWFTYEFLSGGIYDLDSSLKFSNTDMGLFYPRIYLRVNGKDMTKTSDTKQAKSTKDILYRLGLNLQEVSDKIYKAIGSNLSISKYIYFDIAISINKEMEDSSVAVYMFKFFDRIHQTYPDSNSVLQTIADNVCTQTIYFSGLTKTSNQGTYKTLLPEQGLIEYGGSHHIYYQHKDSYEVITLTGLNNTHRFSGYKVSHAGDDENLVIPLDLSLISDLHFKQREIIFNKAFQIQIYMVKVTKQKWYQTSAFKIVLTVVSLAVTAFTGGIGESIFEIAQSILTNVAVNYAVGELAKVAVKLGLSPEIAGVIAIVAVTGLTMSANGFDFRKITAPQIMKALNQSFDFYGKVIQANMLKIQNEMKDLKDRYKSQMERVEEAQKMLNTGVVPIDLELLLTPQNKINLSEDPDDYYNRVFNYDVTEISLSAAEMMIDVSLELPKKVYPYEPPSMDRIEDILLIT